MRLLALALLMVSQISSADVSKKGQTIFSDLLIQQGLQTYWATDKSLWIQNPGGMTKMDLEGIGNTLCGYNQGFFVVTFWQNIRVPSGKIVTVTCRN
jgi:hypothetical protein